MMKHRIYSLWKLGFKLLLLTTVTSLVEARPSLHLNFEDLEIGAEYLPSMDHLAVEWTNGFGEGRVFIDEPPISAPADDQHNRKALRVVYPAGGVGPGETGAQMPVILAAGYEYYLRYDVMFGEDFTWGGTRVAGKLPGLASRGLCSGGSECTGRNGFTARYTWNDDPDGLATLYLYHMDKSRVYGDHHSLGFVFQPGRWHTIIQRVRINDSSGGVVEANGEVETWIDGQALQHLTGLRFVGDGSFLDRFYFSSFVGGGTSAYALPADGTIWFDNIIVSTDPNDVFEQPSLSAITRHLDPAIRNRVYEADLRVAGGLPPYAFNLVSGDLPEGLNLDSPEGRLEGMITSSTGEYPMTIEVSDASGDSLLMDLSLDVQQEKDFSILTSSLPDGALNAAYNFTLRADPDDSVSWSLITEPGNHLPEGLALDADGRISGTPVEFGDFSIRIAASRDSAEVESTLSLQIHPSLVSANLLQNPSFREGTDPWSLYVRDNAEASLTWIPPGTDGMPYALVRVPASAEADWHVQLQSPLPLETGTLYETCLVFLNPVPETIKATHQENTSPYENHATFTLEDGSDSNTLFGPYWMETTRDDPTSQFRLLLGLSSGETALSYVSIRKWFAAPEDVAGPLAGIPESIPGWRFASWLGWFYPVYPWLYLHDHGWIYWEPEPSKDVVKAYLLQKREWISINENVFPFVFSWKVGDWVIWEP